jgi:hypothetical protein
MMAAQRKKRKAPQLPMLPSVTPYSQQIQAMPDLALQITGYHNDAVGQKGRPAAPTPSHSPKPIRYGVTFFGDEIAPYYMTSTATLGSPGGAVWFMPGEDAAIIRSPAAAVRFTGNAPSATRAMLDGRSVYGVAFPTDNLSVRIPTNADSGGYAHYLEGGRTAVRLPDPNGGYLLNPTHELITAGGRPVPPGSILFRLEPNGSWTIVRRF